MKLSKLIFFSNLTVLMAKLKWNCYLLSWICCSKARSCSKAQCNTCQRHEL